jgi:HEAT repeat protein
MALLSTSKKRIVGGVFLLLLAGLAGLWLQRRPILTWYYLRGLTEANESDRESWAERIAGQGEIAVPELLDCLARDDERICANARLALARLCGPLPQDDPCWVALTEHLAGEFPRLSLPGQRCLLTLAAEWVRPAAQPSDATLHYGANLLTSASQINDAPLRTAALDVAVALLAQMQDEELVAPCRELARACLKDEDAANRNRAVHLALYPSLNLLTEVAPLLRDPSVEVRRAVVLAIGASRRVISDENLALALHDGDAEVRRLCEKALRGRGLTQRHIQLARLITDGRPTNRLQVVHYLHADSDLDVGLWLRLLTLDPAEAVRLAAIRAAAEQELPELNERLDQMAKSDPSPTVAQWARYYLARMKRLAATR